jgi:hypothetical protein
MCSEGNAVDAITARASLEMAYRHEAQFIGVDIDDAITKAQSTTACIQTMAEVSNWFHSRGARYYVYLHYWYLCCKA